MSEVQDQNLNSDHLDLKHLDKNRRTIVKQEKPKNILFSIFRLPGRSTPYKEW